MTFLNLLRLGPLCLDSFLWFTPEGYNTDKRKAGWTSPMHVLVQKQVYFQKCTNDLPWGRKTWPEGVLSFTQMFAACTAVTYSWNKTTEIQSDVTRSLNNIRLIADYVIGNHAKHLFCLSGSLGIVVGYGKSYKPTGNVQTCFTGSGVFVSNISAVIMFQVRQWSVSKTGAVPQ